MIVQAFLPFLWLLLMCLRVDGKIHSSDWWAIMWPGVAFFGGWTLMLGLETTFSQFACIADLYKSFFKPLVEAYSSRPRAIAALLVTTLGFASLTVWAILLPLKLNGIFVVLFPSVCFLCSSPCFSVVCLSVQTR